MVLLTIGVLLWAAVHLPKALAPAARAALVDRLGRNAWRGVASLLLLAALVLMVLGFREAGPGIVYRAPAWGHVAGPVVVVAAMVLFVAGRLPTNLKRYLRHPQLLSVVLWGVGHLLAGGDRRGLVLFGGLGLWAVLEMLAINRRDGAWRRPEPVSHRADATLVLAGLFLAALAVAVHEWLGVPVVTG